MCGEYNEFDSTGVAAAPVRECQAFRGMNLESIMPIAKSPTPVARRRAAKSVVEAAETALPPHKPKNVKTVHRSFSLPEPDYAQLVQMKGKIRETVPSIKKSELLCLGIRMLASLPESKLLLALDSLNSKRLVLNGTSNRRNKQ